jgi:hypothetical protein
MINVISFGLGGRDHLRATRRRSEYAAGAIRLDLRSSS